MRTLVESSRSRVFWILVGTFWICGWSTNGLIQTHLIPAAHDHGMPPGTAAGLLAVIGVFDIVGTVGSGWLTDRMDPRLLLFVYYWFRGMSLLVVPWLLGPVVAPPLWVFIVFYGLDWVATVPPRSRCAGPTSAWSAPASSSAGCSPPTWSARASRRASPAGPRVQRRLLRCLDDGRRTAASSPPSPASPSPSGSARPTPVPAGRGSARGVLGLEQVVTDQVDVRAVAQALGEPVAADLHEAAAQRHPLRGRRCRRRR